MKCGGTLDQRAARLWLAKHTPLAALDKSLFVPAVVKVRGGGERGGANWTRRISLLRMAANMHIMNSAS
jgi:hypothetical protein